MSANTVSRAGIERRQGESRRRRKSGGLASAIKPVIETLETRVLMTASVWNNPSNATANWNTAANWTPATSFPNSSADSASFNVDSTVNQAVTLGQDLSVNSLTLGDSTVTGGVGQTQTVNAGSTLTFDNGSGNATLTLASNAVASATINAPIILKSDLTITNNSNQTLTINGNISTAGHTLTFAGSGAVVINGVIAGSGSLVKNDAGSLTLSASNTFTGSTTLNAGTILAGYAASNGVNGNFYLNGGTYEAAASFSTAKNFVLGGGCIQVDDGQTLTIAGILSGNSGFTKTGGGVLILPSANSYTGNTTINGGMILASNAGSIGSAASNAVILNSGTFDATNSFTTVKAFVLNGGSIAVDGGVALTLTGVLSGPGALTKVGNGTLVVAGTSNSFSGGTTVSSGTLKLGASGALPSGSGTGDTTVNGTLNLAGYSQTLNGLSGNGAVDTTAGAAVSLTIGSNDASGTFFGTIGNSAGSLSLIKIGGGTLVLAGANSYSGGTTVSAGALQIGSGGTSGTLGTANVEDDASLVFDRSDDISVPNSVSGTGSLAQNGGGVLALTGLNSYAGGTIVNAGSVVPSPWQAAAVGSSGGSVATDGSGNFTLVGTGSIGPNQFAYSYEGGTTDSFNTAYRSLGSNQQFVAEVTSQQNTGVLAKGGMMFRTDSSATSAFVGVFVTPNWGVVMLDRTASGSGAAAAGYDSSYRVQAGQPVWLKLTTQSGVISGYASLDGIHWGLIGQVTANLGSVPLAALAADSTSATQSSTVRMSNVMLGSITSATVVPAVPYDLKAEAYSGADGRVVWHPIAGAQSITIQQSTDGGATFSTVAVVPGTADTYLPDGLLPNRTYTYRLVATNSIASSSTSPSVSVTTGGKLSRGFHQISLGTQTQYSHHDLIELTLSGNSAPVDAGSNQQAVLRTVNGEGQNFTRGKIYPLGGFESSSSGDGYYGNSYGFTIQSDGSIAYDDTTGTVLYQAQSDIIRKVITTTTTHDNPCDCPHCCSESESAYPVAYADGSPVISATDLNSSGFTGAWSVERNWTSQTEFVPDNSFGYGWMNNGQSYLQNLANFGTPAILVVNTVYDQKQFNYNGTSYVPTAVTNDTLKYNESSDTYTWFKAASGATSTYYGFASSTPPNLQGKLKATYDAGGNAINLTYNSQGQLTVVTQADAGGDVEYFSYSYFVGGPNAGQVSSIQQSMQRSSESSPTVYRQAVYTYYQGTYTGDDQYGNQGDLKTVTIEDGSGNALDSSYYRYYTPAEVDAGQQGFVGALKYVFQSDSNSRLAAVYGDPYSATDTQVDPFADNFFAYDSSERVIAETAAGSGPSTNNGQGTTQFAYYQNPNFPTSGTPDFNTWWMRTTETLPDGNQNIVYTNINKQAILNISTDVVDSASPSTIGVKQITAYQFDSFGRLISTINPSAINTGFYDLSDPSSYEAYADVGITEGGVLANSGLINTTTFYSSTTATSTSAGGAKGYVQADYVQEGLSGTPIEQDSLVYFAATDSAGNTIFPAAASTVYRNTDGTGGETTSYAYAYYSGTNQPYSVTTSAPVISSSQNGPATADVTTDIFDTYGNLIWEKDPNGYISYNGIDIPTGATVQMIRDVNTGSLGGLVDDAVSLPTGWTTPVGGGLALTTTDAVDNLGRTTEETSPNGNVTYNVYDDPDHEVRVYAGWNATTGATTGPTQVYREDWAGSYTETLTTSDAPALSGSAGSYVPTGSEAITVGNIQSLSRTILNDSDQVVEIDAYFSTAGIPTYSTGSTYLGLAGTNYYPTTYAYDAEGRQYQTVEPTGTIDDTAYDGFGRAVGFWAGTNDATSDGTGFNGSNAGSANNMTEVESQIYDNGGAGDSNVTQTTQYVGSGAPDRVTQNAYDWRDRLVATKSGVQASEDATTHRPITYLTYDNLNEVTEQQTFDGDTVPLSSLGSTNGVPNPPASSLLRSDATRSYDDQGRVYSATTFSVDPTSGAVGDGITTNTYYDHDGNVIATCTPGQPTMKYAYDGADRSTAAYTTDGGAVNNAGAPLLDWTDANSVSNDVVVSETDTAYDGDSNPSLTTTKERLSTADTTTPGALSSGNARISYIGSFYDGADRLTAEENVGTNGGTPWTRPASPDASDDTHLVTAYGYDLAGRQNLTTDPRGIEALTVFDLLGRQTVTIAAYNPSNDLPTDNANQTTTYTYDGNDDVLTMTAVMPAGQNSQTTAYVYGVSPSTGSTLFSNDLIATTEYPDPSTGAASSSAANDVGMAYNNLGETISKTDQNGTTHTYSRDVLGRLTLDSVTIAAGNPQNVDTSVLALGYSYNTQGLPFQQTSYSDAAAISVVNQDQDTYNGFGQLTGEYQSVIGAVNTLTTPEVQYAYSSAATGSLPVELVYPNGRILHYGYDNTVLDAALGRVDYLADDNGSGGAGSHLADYGYQGADTILSQADGNGVTLTTTLDQFNRVQEMNWLNTSTGVSTDDFQYGYDRTSNVLYKVNGVNANFSALYSYDSLNRLATSQRGTLSSDHTNITTPNTLPGSSQSWNLDAIGNQTATTTDGTTTDKVQNSQNELTGVGSNALVYDNNGNTTIDENGNTLTYDAWNRMVSDSAGSIGYAYDANSRRITQTVSGTTDAFYISSQDQIIEERQGSTVTAQNVWSIDYVNGVLLRDDNSMSGNLGIASSGLGQRLYSQHDLTFNVTSLADAGGSVVQRIIYTSYGQSIVLTPVWTTASNGYDWSYYFQGMRLATDGENLYLSQSRVYNASTGTWASEDPDQYVNGSNLYQMELGNPARLLDPAGTDAYWGPINPAINILQWLFGSNPPSSPVSTPAPVSAPPSPVPVDVYVVIWDRELMHKEVGHAMVVDATTGQVILSQFPYPHGKKGKNICLSTAETFNREGRPADHIFKIRVPNGKKFTLTALSQKACPIWDWYPMNTYSNSDQTNCVHAAAAALYSGGVPISSDYDWPGNLGSDLDKLSKSSPPPGKGWSVQKLE